ncbi:MAG: ATP-dependent DNA helicase [Candidatus Colwellbacteria bacterium]|nr:ATP-dependent DNA helicase [Candidatus Colwellbacteria bacterium]
MISLIEFEKAYKGLNPAQKEAVDAVEGPVMVIAGPGTGKTHILTLRIANIIRTTDMEPENILALTYSEAGAASMRRELVSLMGGDAYSVSINTFHGFCNDIIKNNPEAFPRMIGSENITDVDQIKMISKAIGSMKLKALKPFGDEMYYLKSARGAINDLKREGIDPSDFREIAKDERKKFDEIEDLIHEKGPHKGKMKTKYQDYLKKIDKRLELAYLYERYEEDLEKEKLYDYDDMIMEVLRAFSNEDLLLSLQEKYQYVLVDEHQDTNRAQNKIVEKLMGFHENPNIFAVGDDKQAIYRFQGASLENFYHFKDLYPKAKLITLEENYRSTQPILDSAESLIKGQKPLKSNRTEGDDKIKLCVFSTEDVEERFLVEDIGEKIKSGTEPAEIAILYRNNYDAFPIADALQKAGIPVTIESDENILGDEDVRKITMILDAADRFGEDGPLIEAMHIDYLGIDPFDIYRGIRFANEKRVSPGRVFRSPETMRAIELSSADKITGFIANLERWSRGGKVKYLAKLFEDIVRDSGALASIISSPDAIRRMERVNGLFREIKNFAEKNRKSTLGDLMEHLSILEDEGVLIKKTNISASAKSVRLMTAHRSKGQQFGYVYIVRAIDGKWGNKRRIEKLPLPTRVFSIEGRELDEEENLGDERRLFYVSITRAKRGVSITYARENRERRAQLPTQFIGEIRPELIKEENVSQYETGTEERVIAPFSPILDTGPKMGDPDLIREVFEKKGLSVTELNAYLACPWRYFYTRLFRIPEADNKHQMYGTAVHGALKDFFEALKERDAGEDFLISKFEYYLKRQPLTEKDLTESLEKGKMSLSGYYGRYSGEWRNNTILEFGMRGVEVVPGVMLNGRIDKMEILNSVLEVNVVDYKTGKQKTRGQIEGATKDSTGDIKRQLVFYKLLLDNYKDRKYRMVSGDIDFIEPDEKGNYRKETFVVDDEEVLHLKDLITVVAEEIRTVAFWNRRCDDPKCEYCAIRNMMD